VKLEDFCATDKARWTAKPVIVQVDDAAWIVATNGHMLAAEAATPGLVVEPPPSPSIAKTIGDYIRAADPTGAVVQLSELRAFAGRPDECAACGDVGRMKCQECHGDARVTCECEACGDMHTSECDNCDYDGLAKCECRKMQMVWILGVPLDASLVAAGLRWLGDGEAAVSTNAKVDGKPDDFLAARAGSRVFVLMRMRPDDEDAAPRWPPPRCHQDAVSP
jgi:hypothetical protein